MNYIDYLKNEKNMDDENIRKIVEFVQVRGYDKKIDYNIKLIYELLNYIEISDNDIEKIIVNNLSILGKDEDYIYKLAFVYKYVDIMHYQFNSDNSYKGLINPKKILMRFMIACIDKTEGLRNTALYLSSSVSDSSAYGSKYKLGRGYILSDSEAEALLNNYLKVGDKQVNVDKYLNSKTLAFRIGYNNYKNNSSKVK